MSASLDPQVRRAISERFAQNMRAARKAADLSQERLGFGASLHRTEIGMLERGFRIPRLDTLVKMAAVLNVSLDELARGIYWQVPDLGGGAFAVARGEGVSGD